MKYWHCIIAALLIAVRAAGVHAADAPQMSQAEVPMPQAECQQRPYSILIDVRNIKEARGTITVDLHGEDPETFLKSGAKLSRTRFDTVAGEMKICLPVEKPGVYALGLYQDRDSNLKFNKTWVGLPSEPFGVSRDAPIRMAAPKHRDAAFEVTGPLTPVIVTLH